MITLMLTPKDQIALMTKKLNEEHGTAQNIKSHVNKLSVLSAITSVLQRLKAYNRVPTNGLIIYSGTVIMDDNKEKKITMDIEPFKPVSRTLYMCDNKFHTDALSEVPTLLPTLTGPALSCCIPHSRSSLPQRTTGTRLLPCWFL